MFGFVGHAVFAGREVRELQNANAALTNERNQATGAGLAALDGRHTALRARGVSEAQTSFEEANEARHAIARFGFDAARLQAYEDALDRLDQKLATARWLGALSRREADLRTWAERKGTVVDGAIQAARVRASAPFATDSDLVIYSRALDEAAEKLGQLPPPAAETTPPAVPAACAKDDPFCNAID